MNIYILHFVIFYFVFHIRWHQNLTLCYFLFHIQWHQKGSVCFSPSNITMNIYLTLCIFYFLFGTKILHYVIFYLVFGGTKRAQFASAPSSITMNIFLRYVIFYFVFVFVAPKVVSLLLPPLASPRIYILHYVIFCFLFHIRWHQNLTLCYFLFPIR